MKKLFSLLLLVALLVTALSSCSDNGGIDSKTDSIGGETEGLPSSTPLSVSGIDAVKLLLAEARLNEKLLKNEGDIFENGVQVMQQLASKAMANLNVTVLKGETGALGSSSLGTFGTGNRSVTSRGSSAILLGSLGEEKQNIGKMEVVGDTVVWTELDEVSNSYEYFLNLTNNIVAEAERCAKLIDFVKKHVRVIDKWVSVGGERYYLSVKENEELLCQVNDFDGTVHRIVCRRYRNADGKDVYEMYRQADTFESRMTYIPGERYEISHGREQHFVASHTKGYWENYVLGDIRDGEHQHYNVDYLIMKDDICYKFGFLQEGNDTIDILSADRQTDLFLYAPDAMATKLFLKLNGFTNIEKYTAPVNKVNFSEDNSYVNASWDSDIQVHLTNGHILLQGNRYCDGKVLIDGTMIACYAYGYASEMILSIQGTPEEALALFKQFLDETGLRCRRDIDDVLQGTLRALSESKTVFQYYRWNGYTVNTTEGIRRATEVENAKYDEMIALYDSVKDAETVTAELGSEEFLQHISFAPLVGNTVTEAKLSGNTLTVKSLTLTVNDPLLFVKDEPYRVILALEDAAGSLVHPEQSSTGEAIYAGETEFAVTASEISVTLPRLEPGPYRVVAYIATADGIRSSGFETIRVDAVEGESFAFNDAILSGALEENGTLTLTYVERMDVSVTIEATEALTYETFRQLVGEAVFAYGIPAEVIEMLVGESYTPLAGNESEIAAGEYRVAYHTENGDSLRSGYAYITLTVSFT